MNLWHINEDTFDPKKLHSQETVYTIGNGYFGTRGTFEEDYPRSMPATLLAGVFDRIPIGREELASVPDWVIIKLFVNNERFRLDQGKILDYHRTLDMQNGILNRSVRWASPNGVRLRVQTERFASLADDHIGAIRYSVTIEEEQPTGEKEFEIALRATINSAVGNDDLIHWETVDQGHEGEIIWLHSQTRHSSVQLIQTMSFTSQTQNFTRAILDSDIAPSIRFQGKLAAGETFTTEKIVVMYTSRDGVDPLPAALEQHKELISSPGTATKSNGQTSPYSTLLANHVEAWKRYWDVSDILIEGDETAQCAIRYNLYQLRISTPVHDNRCSIAAKGLTGFGYHGHVFHDTEIFMLPYFTYVHPETARNLLLYRYRCLPAARLKASRNGYQGAQYPWESASSGEETTPDAIIHPETGEIIPVLNGYIELHITASIAYAVWQYWDVTGDDEFMRDYGAEMLLSTAKFWASRAEYHTENLDYEINDVIGPDEWHERVNNNVYTNYMARWNIQAAITVLSWLREYAPEKADELIHQLDLDVKHLDRWLDVMARMRIPQDKETGVFEQFDGFFKLEPLEQEKYEGRTTSYQGILGMQEVQRHRIIKQADVLMLLTILRQQFDLKTKRANWDYYYPITDHDYGSSLTPALHVILACELSQLGTAHQLFLKGALVDLEDLRGNTVAGIHAACAGAVWQAAVLGVAGLQLTDDGSTASPCWPDGWTRLAFSFCHKGKLIRLDLQRDLQGEEVSFRL